MLLCIRLAGPISREIARFLLALTLARGYDTSMKSKTQKRKEALKRREQDVAFWQAREPKDALQKSKLAIAERDVAALKGKL